MSKLSWNDFVKRYTSRVTFAASVSAALPAAAQFDKNNKKLPTPFALFNEWARNNLVADWASTKVAGGFYLSVSDKQDAETIKNKFGISREPRRTPAANRTFPIGYADAKYASLARSLGYAL